MNFSSVFTEADIKNALFPLSQIFIPDISRVLVGFVVWLYKIHMKPIITKAYTHYGKTYLKRLGTVQ